MLSCGFPARRRCQGGSASADFPLRGRLAQPKSAPPASSRQKLRRGGVLDSGRIVFAKTSVDCCCRRRKAGLGQAPPERRMRLFRAALVAVLGVITVLPMWAAIARADISVTHPELARATAHLSAARGAAVYTALREVWATWDRADPSQVEEVLSSAETSASLEPAQRSYAALLHAYARLRRGDVPAARARIASLGFVDHWLVLGPFDNEGRVGLETVYGPETEFRDPIVPGRAYTGKERTVRWRAAPEAFPFGFLDFGRLLRPDHKVCAYATTYVTAKGGSRAGKQISFWVGAAGAFKVFWNGAVMLSDSSERRVDADRFSARVRLLPGPNNLTVKVCGDESAPVVAVRLADAQGAPDKTLVTSNTMDTSSAAAEVVRGASTKAPEKGSLLGAIQSFDRLTASKNARAEDLEAYARYLVLTGGDDPSVHRARNLAQAAAERDPSVERLLFAAALSEDRNQRDRWIERAERLLGPAQKDERILLARAALAREGPSPRQAFPLYSEVLRQNPDQVDALRGEVELYNDVGLRRTALSVLEGAVARDPRSVLLLNMYASELRALGRNTEASRAEAQYAALRFDDRALLSRYVDLSVARRNPVAAERWIERLLAVEPDDPWALGVAARSYRALGMPERAIAAYQTALSLAPEDAGTLRALSDLQGERGNRDEQVALLGKILEVEPQNKDVREYLGHLEPKGSRLDESYAWEPDKFLKLRQRKSHGENRRTLLDLTVTTMFDNGLSSRFRQIVFQPLSDAAAALGRQYAFQYQADSERVQLRGARVFRTDGTIDEAIESGEAAADNPEIATYTSARNFYVQFPRLEPGDVVELKYRVDSVSSRNEFADYFGEVVYLQSSDPTVHAEYVLVSPATRTLHFDERHIPGLKQETAVVDSNRVYRFQADDVPGVTPEPAMPPWPSVLGFVHASTFDSWKDLGRWYWGLVRDQFDLDDETRKLARKIAAQKQTPLEKVKAVYDWVVSNTRYVALEFGIYGYKPHRCVQTVARGWGDCKDKATVIVTLLKELGIEATIVIVRSGLRGDFDSKIASLSPFDHAIAYVPSLDLYLDGTAEYTGSSELPALDAGSMALRINQGDAELIRLPRPDPEQQVRKREVVATLRRDGSAALDIELDVKGVQAPALRRRFHAESTRKDRVTEELGEEFAGFDPAPSGITASGLDDIEQPVSMKIHGTAARFARREGSALAVPVTPSARLTPLYASLSTRKQPVHLSPIGTLDNVFVVRLPAGTKVKSLPPPAKGDTRFGSYSVTTEEQPGKIIVRSRLTVRVFDVASEDYAAWRTFCADADEALTPRLVVEAP